MKKKSLLTAPELKPLKKKKQKKIVKPFEISKDINKNKKVAENIDETIDNMTFLKKKRKNNQKIKTSYNEFDVNKLKAYQQEKITFYNITDLLELFKQYSGINYENNHLNVS